MDNKNKGENKMKKDSFTELANSMTTEQYLKLVNFAYGELPQEYKDMSDDEILAELVSWMTPTFNKRGRPRKEPTKVIRVPVSMVPAVLKLIKKVPWRRIYIFGNICLGRAAALKA